MKELNINKMHFNKYKSNHSIVAFTYDYCPKNNTCFFVATGFGGGIVNGCGAFRESEDGEKIFCKRLN